jgi:hypothetical protein
MTITKDYAQEEHKLEGLHCRGRCSPPTRQPTNTATVKTTPPSQAMPLEADRHQKSTITVEGGDRDGIAWSRGLSLPVCESRENVIAQACALAPHRRRTHVAGSKSRHEGHNICIDSYDILRLSQFTWVAHVPEYSLN